MKSPAIEHKSRNPEVPPIWSIVLDILATPKPFYNLVSTMKPTDSKKVTEFFQYISTNYTDILENEYVCII